MEYASDNDFQPHWLVRNAHLQSLITGLSVRRALIRMQPNPMLAASREYLLECGEGVRLQGFYTPQPDGTTPRGLVLMLHGWEGNAESTYILSMGRRLFGDGYEVFRLNFRDHGDTHHLNEGIFHSCRINEVVGAVREMARRIPTRPLLTVGFSLGGNFALRLAVRAPESGIPLVRTVAVNPPIDLAACSAAISTGRNRLYDVRFVHGCRRDVRCRGWGILPWHTLREVDERYTAPAGGFLDADDYYATCSAGPRLGSIDRPTVILTSADDPFVSIDAFREIPKSIHLHVEPVGGHMGYLDRGGRWLDGALAGYIESLRGTSE